MHVYVANYEHRHGSEMLVFANADAAEQWRRELAKEYWKDSFGEEPMPDDPEQVADDYFERMGTLYSRGEWFTTMKCEVEGT